MASDSAVERVARAILLKLWDIDSERRVGDLKVEDLMVLSREAIKAMQDTPVETNR
jgi:hypothetical protein